MVLSLLMLHGLHGWLDELLDPEGHIVLDVGTFRPRHRLYLWLSTVQWAWGLLFLFLSLGTWRTEDQSSV